MRFKRLTYKKILVGAAVFMLVNVAFANLAAAAFPGLPLIPCGTKANPTPCNVCDLFKLARNGMDFFSFGLAPLIGTLLFIVGGVLMLLGGAYPDFFAKGKSIFWNTFVGLIVLYSAWMITNTLIKFLQQDNTNVKDKWYEFTCHTTVGGGTTDDGASTPPVVSGVCGQCAAYNPNATCGGTAPVCSGNYADIGVPAKNCSFAVPTMAQKLQQLQSATVGVSWIVTEAFPPTSSHQNAAHCDGGAVDIALTGFSGGPSDLQRLSRLCAAINQVGFSKWYNEYTVAPSPCKPPINPDSRTGNNIHLEI